MLSTIVALGLFPLLMLLSFMHKYESGEEKEYFGLRQTTTVKGMMIMLVFFHHYAQITPDTETISFVYSLVPVSIAFFLFVSGYATYLGHSKVQKIDLKKIWIKRAWRLYLPLFILSIPQNNFLDALLVFLFATDLAFIFIKTPIRRLVFISVINIAYFIVCMALGMGLWWYDDILTYALGVAFAIYKTQILELMKNKRIYWTLLIALILVAVSFGYMALNYRYFTVSITLWAVIACLTIVMVMMKLNVKSAMFYFLG